MFKSSSDVGERAAGVRQHDLELWKSVQRTGADEFRCQHRMCERVVETGVGRPFSKEIGIQIVKENRISQFLDPRQERYKLRLEQIVAVID